MAAKPFFISLFLCAILSLLGIKALADPVAPKGVQLLNVARSIKAHGLRTPQEALRDKFPQCTSAQACKNKVDLLNTYLYKNKDGHFTYRLVILDRTRKKQRPIRHELDFPAEKPIAEADNGADESPGSSP